MAGSPGHAVGLAAVAAALWAGVAGTITRWDGYHQMLRIRDSTFFFEPAVNDRPMMMVAGPFASGPSGGSALFELARSATLLPFPGAPTLSGLLSTAASQYEAGPEDSLLFGLRAPQVRYLVRGRGTSSRDCIWVATIGESELQ